MTVLDINGQPIGESDEQYLAGMVFSWMNYGTRPKGDDIRPGPVLQALIDRGHATKAEARVAGGIIAASIRAGVPVDIAWLRQITLTMLRDRVVRMQIARVVQAQERDNHSAYQQDLAAWQEKLLEWADNPNDEGTAPTPPERVPPPRDRADIMAELNREKNELSARVESVILRPFGQ